MITGQPQDISFFEDNTSFLAKAEALAYLPMNRQTMVRINELLGAIEHARQFRKDALTPEEISARELLKGYIAQLVGATTLCPCCGGTGKAGELL